MKCIYSYEVKSAFLLEESFEVESSGLKFQFHSDNKRLTRLIIVASGVDFKGAYGGRSIDEETGLPVFTIPNDPVFEKITSEAKLLKSALSVWNVFDIVLEYPDREWVPESEEEKAQMTSFGSSMQLTPREKLEPNHGDMFLLRDTVFRRDEFRELEIPLEFFRRGTEDMYYLRFVEAYIDFYFVIEYLWGNGKFKKHGIVNEFLKNEEACKFASICTSMTPIFLRGNKKDTECFERLYGEKTPKEVFERIVKLRGEFHHQSPKRKNNWNPHDTTEFKIDAHFLYHLVSKTLFLRVSKILRFMFS